jgi:Tfp pilus assembly protein PilF
MDWTQMRKINGKLFLALLLSSAVLTAAVGIVHYFQYQRIARALLWQARRAEKDGQITRMARYLERYLEFNPRDNAEKANLAKTWTGDAFAGSVKARISAVRLLDEVLTFEDNQELRRLLVKTALELGNYKLAHDHLAKLLSPQELENLIELDKTARANKTPLPDKLAKVDPPRGELEGYWGEILEQDKKPEQAMAAYRLAIRHAPEVQTSYVRLAYRLRRHNETNPTLRARNLEEADRTINELVARNETAAEAYLARWRYRRDFDLLAIRETGPRGANQPKLEDAAEDVAQALKRKRDSVDVLLAAADLERLRARTAAEHPKLDTKQRRAGLKEHRDKAFEYLRRGLELVSQNRGTVIENGECQLLWHKGNLLLDDLEFQRAEAEEEGLPPRDATAIKDEIRELIARVRKSRVPAVADYMNGRLFAHDRKWAEAASLFERARTLMASQPDLACQADLYLGQCYERLEEHTQMYNAFKRVADQDPNSVPAQVGMAAARWAQGKRQEASDQYQRVVSQQMVPPRVWIDIARLEIQRQTQAARPDWTDAEKALVQAEKVNPKALIEVRLLQAEVLVRKNQLEAARALLEKEKKHTPNEVDLWTALAELALREKKKDQARTILDEARAQLGDKANLRLAEARFYLATKVPGALTKLSALAKDLDRFSEDDQARLLGGLADAQLRGGNDKEARALWESLANLPKQKNDLRLRLLLFDLAMKDNDEPGMNKALDGIRAVEQSNGAYQRYGQALLLIRQASQADRSDPGRAEKLRKARAELDRVLTQRPSWPPVFLARAEIAELTGDEGQAVKDLQQAYNNGERSPSVLFRLITLLFKRDKDSLEAKRLLDEARAAARYSADLGRLQAWNAIREGKIDRALAFARNAVREDTKNPRELLWKAQVLEAANLTTEVGKTLDAAIKNAGDDPSPWVMKVQFLLKHDQKKAARDLITRAEKELPADQAPLVLGLCCDALGETKEALAHYAKALETKPGDMKTVRAVAGAHASTGRLADAEPLLRRIVKGNLKGGAGTEGDWARRTLAVVLAGGTDYRRFTEALELVGLKLDEEGRLLHDETPEPSTDNRRARARVLAAQQGQRQFRTRAIEILEELRRQGELTADDKFILALLLETEGKTRDALSRLSELVQPETRTPQYLAQYGLSLISQRRGPGDLDEAEKIIGWLTDLEKARKTEPNTFASVELRARLLEARNKAQEAIDLLEQHALRPTAKPEEVLLVLAAMSRQKRYRQAYALCEKTWAAGQCPPEVVGGVSVGLLRVMNPTDAQVETVEKHLLEAVTKKPKSVVLKMHLADLYDKRGQYDKSAEQYRKVLADEPNNVVALNNLAWLLATRDGDADKALEHITRAVNGMGRRADLLDTRGLVHLRRKDLSKALEDLKEASTDAPTPTRLYHLALAYHREGNTTRARELLAQAREKGLKVAGLHPIEQKQCQELLTKYSLR